MSSSAKNDIDRLLADKLHQVIGSSPASVAESLVKMGLQNKKREGIQMFAVSIFAAAVNKATLETFLSDARFGDIRPLVTATLAIAGKPNMTALTLLGHCLLTTEMASNVTFSAEFRKKMGQASIWDGELSSGSLSDKQKAILAEKKRLIDAKSAKALGSGFLKFTGLDSGRMTADESALFGNSARGKSSEEAGAATALSTTGNASGAESSAKIGSNEASSESTRNVTTPDLDSDEAEVPA